MSIRNLTPDEAVELIATFNRDPQAFQQILRERHFYATGELDVQAFLAIPQNLLRIARAIAALATPVPDNVRTQGPEATLLFRRMIFNGVSPDEAIRVSGTQSFGIVAGQMQAVSDAHYEGRSFSVFELALLAQGEMLLYGDEYPGGSIQVPCTAGTTCQIALDKFKALMDDDEKRQIIFTGLEKGLQAVIDLEGSIDYPIMIVTYYTLLKCAVDEPEIFNSFVAQYTQDYFDIGAKLGFDRQVLEDIQFQAADYSPSQDPEEDVARRQLIKVVWNASFSKKRMNFIGLAAGLYKAGKNAQDMGKLLDKLSDPEERAELAAQVDAAWDLITNDSERFGAIFAGQMKASLAELKAYFKNGNDADAAQWMIARVLEGGAIKTSIFGVLGTLKKVAWETFDDIPGIADDVLIKLAKENPTAYIDLVRKKNGMPEIGGGELIKGDGKGTVAFVDLGDGKPVFGLNSRDVKRVNEGVWKTNNQANAEIFKDLSKLFPDDYPAGSNWSNKAAFLNHGEAAALVRAHTKNGNKLPETINMTVDRATCDLYCQRNLGSLMKALGVKKMEIRRPNGALARIDPSLPRNKQFQPISGTW